MNCQKIRKSQENHIFSIYHKFLKVIFFQKEKKNLCFLILGLHDLTRALQSSPILRIFFSLKKNHLKKNAIPLVFQY